MPKIISSRKISTFAEMLDHPNEVFPIYFVDGCKLMTTFGRLAIENTRYYGNNIPTIWRYDKIGRELGGRQWQEHWYINGRLDSKIATMRDGLYFGTFQNQVLFIDKNDAYNCIIEHIKKQKQALNKKIIEIQNKMYKA